MTCSDFCRALAITSMTLRSTITCSDGTRYTILSCDVLKGKQKTHKMSSSLSTLITLPYKGTGLWGRTGRKGWMAIIVGLLTFLLGGAIQKGEAAVFSRHNYPLG